MLEGLISLAWYGSGGEGIGGFLNEMADAGFFEYLLPFLLIFAIVYGILTQIKLFKESKAVNGVIALVVGLMALQFDFVPRFFSEIFPRFGIALSVLLMVLIMIGLFTDVNKSWIMYALLGLGGIMIVIVLLNTAGSLGWSAGNWWYDNWFFISAVAFVLVVIAIIIGAGKKGTSSYRPLWAPVQPNPNNE